MADTKNLMFLDLTGLGQYDARMKTHIDTVVGTAVAPALKGLAINGNKLLAYKDLPIEGATPAYEIELPEADLSGLLEKFEAATAGHVITVAEDGKTIVDSGVALADLATKAEVADVQADADAAMAKAEALEALAGVIPEGYTESTIIAYINKKAEETLAAASGGSTESAASVLAALNTYKAENDPKVAANTAAIEKLNGDVSVEGSVKNTFNLMLAEALAGADADFDTLIEMSNWLAEHADSAAEMNTQITNNKTAIDKLTEYVGTLPEDSAAKNVVEYIQEALAAQDFSVYATVEALNAAIADIQKNKNAIAVVEAALAPNGATYLQIEAAAKKGEDAQTSVDALQAYVGTFVSDDESVTTVCAYIDAKCQKVAADIEARLAAVEAAVAAKAEQADLEALAERVTANEGGIAQNAADIAAVTETVEGISAISEEDINALFE